MANFLLEYLRQPRRVGAVAPSGRALAEKMMEPIDFDRARLVVEYGPGTGSFTEELCRRKRPDTVLVLIEQNRQFYDAVRQRFRGQPGVIFVRGSAERADCILSRLGLGKADYVVSGLPFASLPKRVSLRVFAATNAILSPSGRFITFQYTLVKERFFRRYFDLPQKLFVPKNLPPAFVFVCAKLGESSAESE
ncbi:MAG: SAM-dependent methyltransferase [Oscillospiraceae bacterium]|nr:SAM-dependent methyltransferase [Oscillospiraceae bacterium]